jgi:flagellar assembly protein FliH
MKSWRETLPLAKPFRQVCLAYYGPALAEWERRLQEREQAGLERGRQEGEKALSEQLVRQRGELIELHDGVIQSLARALPQVVQEAESVLIQVALETARKIVATLPISADMVEASVRQALAQVQETAELKVWLHPEDLALLQQAQSPLISPDTIPAAVEFAGSPEVDRGGCLVQTCFGVLDARRETRFRLVKEAVQP